MAEEIPLFPNHYTAETVPPADNSQNGSSASGFWGGNEADNAAWGAQASQNNLFQRLSNYHQYGSSYVGRNSETNPPLQPDSSHVSYNCSYGDAGGGGMHYEMNSGNQMHHQHYMTGMPSQPLYGGPLHCRGFMTPMSNITTGTSLLSGQDNGASISTEGTKRKRRKKEKGRPKRPLSAYNLFFRDERARILESIPSKSTGEESECDKKTSNEITKDNSTKINQEKNTTSDKAGSGIATRRSGKKQPHGKIGFEPLAKMIGKQWKELSSERKAYYKTEAEKDSKRYAKEMEEYGQKIEKEKKQKEEQEKTKEDKKEDGEQRNLADTSELKEKQSESPKIDHVHRHKTSRDNVTATMSAFQKNDAETKTNSEDKDQEVSTAVLSVDKKVYDQNHYSVYMNSVSKRDDGGKGAMDANRHWTWENGTNAPVQEQYPSTNPSVQFSNNCQFPMQGSGNNTTGTFNFNGGQWGAYSGQQHQHHCMYDIGESNMTMGEQSYRNKQQMYSGWQQQHNNAAATPNENIEQSYRNKQQMYSEWQQQQNSAAATPNENMQLHDGACMGPAYNPQQPQYGADSTNSGFVGNGTEFQW